MNSVGVVGLGSMGSAMASRLLHRGLSLAVYNRTAARAEPLRIRGADVVACPSEVGRRASVIITCVTDDEAVGQVLLGPDGVLQGAAPGTILLETSTIGPDASAGFAPACAAAGVAYLRAPISGSVAHAATGSLAFLVSGPRHAFGLVLGEKAGLDWRSMLEVFETSAVASPLVRNKLRTLVERDFAPGAATRLLAKDFELMLGAGRSTGSPLPVAGLVRQLLDESMSGGEVRAAVRRLENDAAGAERGDLVGRVAQLGQDGVVVLAE